jgi:hypothetical protein
MTQLPFSTSTTDLPSPNENLREKKKKNKEEEGGGGGRRRKRTAAKLLKERTKIKTIKKNQKSKKNRGKNTIWCEDNFTSVVGGKSEE